MRQESKLNASHYLTPEGTAEVRAAIEAQRAYLEQLREARACDATRNLLARVAVKQRERRFTADAITNFGGLS